MKTYEQLADEFAELMYEVKNPRDRLKIAAKWADGLSFEESLLVVQTIEGDD